MKKLKLAPLIDDRPVKLIVTIPASLHRTLIAYAEALAALSGTPPHDPAKLIGPMLEEFIKGDHAFREIRRKSATRSPMVNETSASARAQD